VSTVFWLPADVAAVIPVLNEEGAIGPTVAGIPRDAVGRVIVVDGGSRDGTVAEAQAAGAEVVVAPASSFSWTATAVTRPSRVRG
jgi:glycosyltransferase involved in cell wall biosynthesis